MSMQNTYKLQSSAIIMRSNIVRYYMNKELKQNINQMLDEVWG